MNEFIERHFEKMGARARVTTAGKPSETRGWNGRIIRSIAWPPFKIDIRRDGKGEYFDITRPWDVDVQVLDVQSRDRHPLMMARMVNRFQSKFLCGHDERSWFVAAIPESATANSVSDAKDALKPEAVWESIRAHKLPAHRVNSR
jgi:hypothetical protein